MNLINHWINGTRTDVLPGRTGPVYNPASGAIQAEGFGQVLINILYCHTQPAPGDPPLRFQLIHNIAHHTDRYRKG